MDKDAYIAIGMSILFFVSVAYCQYDERIRTIERKVNKLTLITTPVKYSPMERFKMSRICPDYHYTVSTSINTPIEETDNTPIEETDTPIEGKTYDTPIEGKTYDTPLIEENDTPLIEESIGDYVEIVNDTKARSSWFW